MLDRFKDAKWYIGSSRIEGASTMPETIYDLSDEGNIRPVHPHIGHAVVCQGAVIEDAQLIASAPALLQVAYLAVEMGWGGEHHPDCDDEGEEPATGCICGLSQVMAAIAKAEGRA